MINTYGAEHGHTIVAWYEEHISARADLLARDTAVSGMIKYLVRKQGAVILSTDSNGNGKTARRILMTKCLTRCWKCSDSLSGR
jgi:hypothetical protein